MNTDGSPRTTSSSARNTISRSGLAAIEATSSVMPEATKNSGMKNP